VVIKMDGLFYVCYMVYLEILIGWVLFSSGREGGGSGDNGV